MPSRCVPVEYVAQRCKHHFAYFVILVLTSLLVCIVPFIITISCSVYMRTCTLHGVRYCKIADDAYNVLPARVVFASFCSALVRHEAGYGTV